MLKLSFFFFYKFENKTHFFKIKEKKIVNENVKYSGKNSGM